MMELKRIDLKGNRVYRGETYIGWVDGAGNCWEACLDVEPFEGRAKVFTSRKAALQWIDEKHKSYIMRFFKD